MKRNVFAVFASLVLAGVLVAAQDPPASAPAPQAPAREAPAPQAPAPAVPAPEAPTPAPAAAPAPQAPAQAPAPQAADQSSKDSDEKTLTGCLVQGSGPNVFIFENAKLATDAKNAKGERYVLEITAPPDQIKSVINTQVRIVGKAETKAASAPAGQKLGEADLPKLTATRITRVSDRCMS